MIEVVSDASVALTWFHAEGEEQVESARALVKLHGERSISLAVIDLTAYEGQNVQIRFRFASDGYVTQEGWYIDDISITSTASTTSVDDDMLLPARFALRQNAPNPFNPVTTIGYALPQAAHVTIDVYSISGRLVKRLVDEEQQAGYRSVSWDGRNDRGQRVASATRLRTPRSLIQLPTISSETPPL